MRTSFQMFHQNLFQAQKQFTKELPTKVYDDTLTLCFEQLQGSLASVTEGIEQTLNLLQTELLTPVA